MSNRLFKILFLGLFLTTLLAFSSITAYADEGISGAMDDVLTLVEDIAIAVVRLLLVVSGALFTLGVARGAFDGVLGSALGNAFTASSGVYRAIGAGVAFVVLLFGVGFAGNFVEFVAERFLSAESLEMPVIQAPQGGAQTSPKSMEEALQLEPVQDLVSTFALAVVRLLIGAGAAIFTVAVGLGAFDAQLGNVLGNNLAVSRGYARILGAAGAVLFLILAMPLSRQLVETLVPRMLAGGIQMPQILP